MLRGASSPAEAVATTMPSLQGPAVEREGLMAMVMITPMSIPEAVAAQKLSLRLEPGATVQDLVAALAAHGVPIIISDEEAAAKTFYLPHFNGTVGELTRALSQVVDVYFTWRDGLVVVSTAEQFAVSIPQDEKLAETLTEGISALGGEAVARADAGMLVFTSSPRAFTKISRFIERQTNNSALVTLEVALLTVALNDDIRRGVDWDGLAIAVGRGAPGLLPKADNGTGTSGSDGEEDVLAKAVNNAVLAGGVLKGGIFNQNISVTAVLNMLDAYGASETLQNVRTKTLSGHEAELSSVTEIPYIKSVGATTSAVSGGSSVVGSSESATAEDGVSFKLKPTYDRDANTVTVELDLTVSSVIGFNNLSAGNQLGSLTQPTTAKRTLTDILRLRPGQTAIIGGVIYESLSDSRSTFGGLKSLENRTLSKKRNEMFIVVRPTVAQFGKVEYKETATVGDALLPGGEAQDFSLFSVTPKPEKADAEASSVKVAPQFRTPGGVPVKDDSAPAGGAAAVPMGGVQ